MVIFWVSKRIHRYLTSFHKLTWFVQHQVLILKQSSAMRACVSALHWQFQLLYQMCLNQVDWISLSISWADELSKTYLSKLSLIHCMIHHQPGPFSLSYHLLSNHCTCQPSCLFVIWSTWGLNVKNTSFCNVHLYKACQLNLSSSLDDKYLDPLFGREIAITTCSTCGTQ